MADGSVMKLTTGALNSLLWRPGWYDRKPYRRMYSLNDMDQFGEIKIISLKVWTLLLSEKNMPNVRRKLKNQSVKLRCDGPRMRFFSKGSTQPHLLVAVRHKSSIRRKTMPMQLQIFVKKNVTVSCFQIFWEQWKTSKFPATDEQLDKVLSNKAMFDGSSIEERFVSMNQILLVPWPGHMDCLPLGEMRQCVAGLIYWYLYNRRRAICWNLNNELFITWKSSNLSALVQNQSSYLAWWKWDPTRGKWQGWLYLAPTDLAIEIVNVLTKMGFEVW